MSRLVLFLDDDAHRRLTFNTNAPSWWTVFFAPDASTAFELLGKHRFDVAFLDHDLHEEDVMSVVGQPTKCLTGMAVVDRIVKMIDPPPHVVVHTMNPPAAEEMCRRLAATRRIIVQRLSFPLMIEAIKRQGPEDSDHG